MLFTKTEGKEISRKAFGQTQRGLQASFAYTWYLSADPYALSAGYFWAFFFILALAALGRSTWLQRLRLWKEGVEIDRATEHLILKKQGRCRCCARLSPDRCESREVQKAVSEFLLQVLALLWLPTCE